MCMTCNNYEGILMAQAALGNGAVSDDAINNAYEVDVDYNL